MAQTSSEAASRQRLRNRITTTVLFVVGGALLIAVIVLAVMRAYSTEESLPTPTVPAASESGKATQPGMLAFKEGTGEPLIAGFAADSAENELVTAANGPMANLIAYTPATRPPS